MKIAVISDTHFGYAIGTERGEDSFVQAEEAVDRALKGGADLILMPGDLFDFRTPTQDIFARAMSILRKAQNYKSGIKVASTIKSHDGKAPETHFFGVPIVTIYGTHERRGQGFTNPVQILEKAGICINLHFNGIVFEKNGEKVAVQGMSGVHERYAHLVLEKFNPKPVEGAYNIFLVHQSFKEYIYSPNEPPTLTIDDLPTGFDLTINGHIHWHDFSRFEKQGFMIAGSTILTQKNKKEIGREKGFTMLENGKPEFIKLDTQRTFHWVDIDFETAEPLDIEKKILESLKKISNEEIKPIVKVVLKGKLKEGFSSEDINVKKLQESYKGDFLLEIKKSNVVSDSVINRDLLIEKMREKRMSIDEIGLEMLTRHLDAAKYKGNVSAENLLNNLSEGNLDEVYDLIVKKESKDG